MAKFLVSGYVYNLLSYQVSKLRLQEDTRIGVLLRVRGKVIHVMLYLLQNYNLIFLTDHFQN